MRGKWAILALAVALVAGMAMAQAPVRTTVDRGTASFPASNPTPITSSG
jgi:hypothetical protein